MTKKDVLIWLKKLRWLLIVLLLFAPVLYFVHVELDLCSLVRSLPSDEKMIASFREHREDFERLIRLCKSEPSIRHVYTSLIPTPDMQTIMKRAKVSAISSDMYAWLPADPYSDTARNENIHNYGRIPPKEFSGIKFYANGTVRRFDADLSRVNKYYYYTPVVPRIKKGPFSYTVNGHTYSTKESEAFLQTPIHSFPLYKSLNKYPQDFLPTECVYRQIEPQWFIGMCNLGE